MLKIHKILPVFAFLAFILISMPFQDAYAAVDAITYDTIINDDRFSADFTLDYTVADTAGNTAASGSVVFTESGTAVDGADPHTYVMAVPGDTSSIAHSITRATLEANAEDVAFTLVDGATYDIVVSIVDGPTTTATVTGIDYDTSDPTMDSAIVTSGNTIDVTFSEDLLDASVVAGDFTLDQSLTVSGVAEAAGVVTITTNEIIADGATPLVTLAGNGVDDIIDEGTANTLAAGATVTAGTTTISQAGQGSGCRSDCQAPTLGVNSEGDRFVTNGFTYNGKSTDVESFYTPYPLITANVGQQNKAVFKIYDNYGPQNVAHFSFAFGLGDDQIISESKAMIELDIDFDGTETVTITDPENALENVRVRTSTGNCNSDFAIECLIVTIDHTFRAPLDFNMVGTDVWDTRLNSWQNYYNHGIEVVGESLNPPNEYFGIYQGELIHLIETGKNIAIDGDGNLWTFDNTWIKDYIYKGKTDDPMTSQGYDRDHVKFNTYKQEQELVASSLFEKYYKTSVSHEPEFSEIDDIKFYEFPDTIDKKFDSVLKAKMQQEDIRAQKYLEELFARIYPNLAY